MEGTKCPLVNPKQSQATLMVACTPEWGVSNIPQIFATNPQILTSIFNFS